MKRMLAAALALLVPMSPAAAETGQWKRIFDGKSLKGWIPKVVGAPAGVNLGNSFTVRNRAIRVDYKGWKTFDNRIGHLAYHRPLKAYRLRLEYRLFGTALPNLRWWQHSNSGLMLFGQSPQSMRIDQGFPVSLEMQLVGSDRAQREPSGNLCTPGTNFVAAGQVITRHCNPSTSPIMRHGTWVKAEVEVLKDGRVTHFINGKPVLRYSGPQLAPTEQDAKPLIAAQGGKLGLDGGYIYLQSEGAPVEFRNIELMEL